MRTTESTRWQVTRRPCYAFLLTADWYYLDPYIAELLTQLDGLPLAIVSAGAYLKQSVITCREYLKLYKESWLQLQQLSPQQSSLEQKSMHTTWKITLNQIMRQHRHAAVLLKQWIAFNSNDIWYGLFQSARPESASDPLVFDTAMAVLSRYGWVEPGPVAAGNSQQGRGYSLQKCIHAWLQYEDCFVSDIDLLTQLAVLKISTYQLDLVTKFNFFSLELPDRNRLLPHADRCLEIYLSSGKDKYNSLFDLKAQLRLADLYMIWSTRASPIYTCYLDFLCQPYEEKRNLAKSQDLYCLLMEKLDMQQDQSNREVQDMMSKVYHQRGLIMFRNQQFVMASKMFRLSIHSNAPAYVSHIKLTQFLSGPIFLIPLNGLIFYILLREEDFRKDVPLNMLLLFVKPIVFLHLLISQRMQRWKTLLLWAVGHACFQVYYSSIQPTLNWGAFICGTYGEVAIVLLLMPMLFREGIY